MAFGSERMESFNVSIARAWPAITMAFVILLLVQDMTALNTVLVLAMVTSAGLNFFLKDMIRQHRPVDWETSKGCGMFKECCGDLQFSYGMPSGHAQCSVVFAICYTYLLLRGGIHWGQISACALLWAWTAYVCLTRVQLRCHTKAQVMAGVVIGAAYAWGWVSLFHLRCRKGAHLCT